MKKNVLPIPLVLLIMCALAATGCKREAELYYDASEYAVDITGHGYTATQDVECCVVFAASKLQGYVGWRIAQIRIFNPDQKYEISYTPEVYEARAGISNPDGLISKNASPAQVTSLNWKTIDLNTPVTIKASTDYWAGYKVRALPGQYPLAVGEEPSYSNSYLSTGFGFASTTRNLVLRIVVRR